MYNFFLSDNWMVRISERILRKCRQIAWIYDAFRQISGTIPCFTHDITAPFS